MVNTTPGRPLTLPSPRLNCGPSTTRATWSSTTGRSGGPPHGPLPGSAPHRGAARPQRAQPAERLFRPALDGEAAAGVQVVVLQGLLDLPQGDAMFDEGGRIDEHLVLLTVAALDED